MPRRLTLVLPLLTSLLYVLTFPKFGQAWLAWFALVPLVVFLAETPTRRSAFFAGWLSGTLAYAGILYWIIVTYQAAHLSTALAIVCLTLLAAFLGLYWGAWAWFVAKQRNIFLGAAAWAALEYLRTHLFSGFPWALLGDSQVKNLPLIQIASITGPYGISFMIVLINLAIAQSMGLKGGAWHQARIYRGFGATALLLIGVYGFGYRSMQQDIGLTGKPFQVALLQGNIDQYKKWDKAYVTEIETAYEGLVHEASRNKPNLIVWPETSVPGYLLQDPPLQAWLGKVVRHSGSDHLLGSPMANGKEAYNGALYINHEGNLVGEYDKTHLVPFGEIVPMAAVLGRVVRVLNDLGGFTAGQRSPVLSAGGIPVAVNICYEALFPDLVRRSVLQGGEVIANLTNDGWYMRTAAPYQHWAPNVLRAVENDRWVIRADNTGISGIIDPTGHVTAMSAIFVPVVIEGTVFPKRSLTFYTRHGDVFAWICSAAALIGCL